MQLVIADTGPINYLILIGHIEILPALFHGVILPSVVRDELNHPKASATVRQWICNLPEWAEVRATSHTHTAIGRLDAGEADVIALALELHADVILMDDREGVINGRSRGFRVAGTLGLLSMAAEHRLLNLAEAFDRIKRTSFHYQQEVMDQLLAEISG